LENSQKKAVEVVKGKGRENFTLPKWAEEEIDDTVSQIPGEPARPRKKGGKVFQVLPRESRGAAEALRRSTREGETNVKRTRTVAET